MPSNISPADWDKLLLRLFGPPAPPSKVDHILRAYIYGPRGCPVCHQTGGFHDADIHGEHQVPRELLKESGWQKKDD